MKNIYDFKGYKEYLVQCFGGEGKRTGLRSQAAKVIGCHPTFLSHVLQGKVDLSLEQAERLNDFLNHSEEEAHFFLVLIQKDRAGTQPLKKYFQTQLDSITSKRLILSNRISKSSAITKEQEAKFYSSWMYGAVHVLLSIPELQTKENIGRYLRISNKKVSEILEFLLTLGLAKTEGGRYTIGANNIHLSGNSENISRHHSNWRMKAINSFEDILPDDIHYSAAVTLSKKDVKVIMDRILSSMKDNLDIISNSKEEEAYVYCFDFFKLK
jgi:uncharacterized protein (TIGR02147 family)